MIPAALILAAAALPQDVARFVERRRDCEHYAGEEPYDPPRARFLARMDVRLHCSTVERDERRLRRRHRGDRAVLSALNRPAD